MGIRVVTPPAEELIDLATAKLHLRIDGPDEDLLVGSLITAARLTVERQCWRQLASATLRFSCDAFPDGPIYLPRPPLQSVTTINYTDSSGTQRELNSSEYHVDAESEPGRIVAKSGWPATANQPGCVSIDYVAGMASLPEDLQAAILLIVGHLYANREAVVAGQTANELPLGVNALLAFHRFRDYRVREQLVQ